MAVIKGLDRKDPQTDRRIIQVANLVEAAKRPLGGYSGGMKQRVGIAQALFNDSKVLIVDEPTVGLDPEERVRFRNLFSDLSGERIVILSTHIVSDVESTATHIALIVKAAAPQIRSRKPAQGVEKQGVGMDRIECRTGSRSNKNISSAGRCAPVKACKSGGWRGRPEANAQYVHPTWKTPIYTSSEASDEPGAYHLPSGTCRFPERVVVTAFW